MRGRPPRNGETMREEYPRPQLRRKSWMSLNGQWDFWVGERLTKIEVPFVVQSALSGIHEKIDRDDLIYERSFAPPAAWKNRRVLLHFGAVDYSCKVFLNGQLVGAHSGGQTPFQFDITALLQWNGSERLRVEVYDPLHDESIARGKQFWGEKPTFIWYTPSSGIWQSVWLEPVSETYLQWVRITPDLDAGTARLELALSREPAAGEAVQASIAVTFCSTPMFSGCFACGQKHFALELDVFRQRALAGSFHFQGNAWSPEEPNLYEVQITLKKRRRLCDEVTTYFGMRKIAVVDGRLYLNNRPYYQKLILDQGYWQDGLVTAPDETAYQKDIRLAKAMGFNGCRKHEKVEDPVFLYWADRLGFLVWASMASCWVYSPETAANLLKEWPDVIARDYNHPCIVVWGMLNESWGVPKIQDKKDQQSFAQALYYLAHALDGTRLVISNDGWEMTETDLCAIHSYCHGKQGDTRQQSIFRAALKNPAEFYKIMEKKPFAGAFAYHGQPVLLTECGGITTKEKNDLGDGWGYTAVEKEDFLSELQRVFDAIYDADCIQGFCYTQLTDVEQEKNGLLTCNHEPKYPVEAIRKILSR